MKEIISVQLNRCQNDLETLFQNLGKAYSNLMEEINDKTTTAETIIEEYRKGITRNEENSINSVVKFLEENVQYLTHSLNLIDEQLDESINVLSKNLQQFSVVEDNIYDIKENSELMELMALNSMVVAIKAGSKGGGFTYITEVLRKNATSTIQLSDELKDLGIQLKNNLGDLHNLMSELNEKRHQVEDKQKKMEDRFNLFHNSMEELMSFLDKLSSESTGVRKKVLTISEEISHQDLYRQSLDHISILLDKWIDDGGTNNEEKLDQLSYREFIGKFSDPLIHEVVERLNKNILLFHHETQDIDSTLQNVEDHRKGFIGLRSLEDKKACCIFQKLQLLDEDLNSLVDSVSDFFREIEDIVKVNRSIMDRIVNLNDRNMRFDRILKAFRNVIIMGRIEVTKHEALRGVDVSVNDIAKITDNIEEKVANISDSIALVMQMNQTIVERLQNVNSQISGFLLSFRDKLENFKKIKEESQQTFNRVMDRLNFYPDHYKGVFRKSYKAVDGLKDLSQDLKDLLTQIDGYHSEAVKEKNSLLSQMGLEKWEIRNKNINETLSKFTIFSQKNLALKLSGESELDKKVNSENSITLF